jgi:hypothetical protein
MDMSGWGEVTVRTPGAFADVREMNAVMRELFSEESILNYQRRVTEAGLREAIEENRELYARATQRRGGVPRDMTQLIEGLLSMFDPDHERYNGYYPSLLLCPLHEQPDRPGYNPVSPVFSRCPGAPRCRAHEGVRVEG